MNQYRRRRSSTPRNVDAVSDSNRTYFRYEDQQKCYHDSNRVIGTPTSSNFNSNNHCEQSENEVNSSPLCETTSSYQCSNPPHSYVWQSFVPPVKVKREKLQSHKLLRFGTLRTEANTIHNTPATTCRLLYCCVNRRISIMIIVLVLLILNYFYFTSSVLHVRDGQPSSSIFLRSHHDYPESSPPPSPAFTQKGPQPTSQLEEQKERKNSKHHFTATVPSTSREGVLTTHKTITSYDPLHHFQKTVFIELDLNNSLSSLFQKISNTNGFSSSTTYISFHYPTMKGSLDDVFPDFGNIILLKDDALISTSRDEYDDGMNFTIVTYEYNDGLKDDNPVEEKLEEEDLQDDPYYDFFDDIDYGEVDCIRPQWTFQYHPTCLLFHEMIDPALKTIDISKQLVPSNETDTTSVLMETVVEYISSGYFRDSWRMQIPFDYRSSNISLSDEFAFKRMKLDHKYQKYMYAKMQIEGVLMEKFTSSPFLMNLYGHCGMNSIMEIGYDISHTIVPFYPGRMYSRGRIPQSSLDIAESFSKGKPYPFNSIPVEMKLEIATRMAQSIEKLHGVGVVHDDVHVDQWLLRRLPESRQSVLTTDGSSKPSDHEYEVVLNDMNTAEFLSWNVTSNENYCTYYTSFGGPYRSPEEYVGSEVDVSTDIWPYGGLLFSLITGLYPYYNETSDAVIQNVTVQGIPPYLSPMYYNRSYIEHHMIDIMNGCFQLDPKKRLSIQEIVQKLQETKENYTKLTT